MSTNKFMAMFQKDEKNLKGSEITAKERVFTPSPSLNWALGGGLYKGYTTCFYGPESSGKSLLATMGVGALMKADPEAMVMYISTEMRPPVPERLIPFGVDPDRFMLREANTVHDVFDYIASDEAKFTNSDGEGGSPGLLYMLKEGAPIKALVIDSIKGIRGPKEINAVSAEKDIMGDLSKYLNPALRQILPILRKYNLMTIFVQQVTENLNADEVKYQNIKYKIPSGMALKHFCESVGLVERVTSKDSKLFSTETKSMRDIPLQEGHTVRVKMEKANLDKPFREAEFRINYTKGIVDTGLEVAKLAAGLNVIDHPKSESGKDILAQWGFYNNNGELVQKWIGWDNMVEALEASPELRRSIMNEVLTKTS